MLAPSVLGLKGSARAWCYGFGAAAAFLNGLTDQPFTVKRLISFRVHGQADTPFVPLLLLLPWATGALKQPKARVFFTGYFLAALTNYLLTDYDRLPAKRSQAGR
ncbi:hypothetical protein [Deinococcus arboris]|uniref:hypothetical protein n=1 Tax=Deinococcus arboris TaxID=2682977 RepID=UPI0018DE9A7D|nr:hypothetical protein [Deinococcus arboris]